MTAHLAQSGQGSSICFQKIWTEVHLNIQGYPEVIRRHMFQDKNIGMFRNCLLLIFSSCLEPDQARQNIGPDLTGSRKIF